MSVPLQLLLSPRVPLVGMDTVVAARGESVHIIEKYVEQGHLMWAFDVAVKQGHKRDLRFWNKEVSPFAARRSEELAVLHKMDVDAVVKDILGDRPTYTPGELCLLLRISRPTLMRLRPELSPHGEQTYLRANIVAFLKRRRVR